MTRVLTKSGPYWSGPNCLGEPIGPDTVLPGGARLDAAQFTREDRVEFGVGAAGAAIGATAIPTDAALAAAIPANATLEFASGKLAQVTSAGAAAGASSIPVVALREALAGTDTGFYAGKGNVRVPAGTAVGRTITERNAGTGFGPAVDTDDEIYLVAAPVDDASEIDEFVPYRHGRIVYENFLPNVASMASALLTKLRGLYHMTVGA